MYRSTFFTTALVGGEWSALRPCHFNPVEKNPWYSLNRRLGGPHLEKRKFLTLTGLQFRSLDYATAALNSIGALWKYISVPEHLDVVMATCMKFSTHTSITYRCVRRRQLYSRYSSGRLCWPQARSADRDEETEVLCR
jgi:hypothetical protein